MEKARRIAIRNIALTADVLTKRMCFCSLALSSFMQPKEKRCLITLVSGWMARCYQDRKLVAFFLVHFLVTMVVIQHHFYEKFRPSNESLDVSINRYWGKLLVPPFEFSVMHAILLQMALLPLTMCRHLMVRVSQTILQRIVPFEKVVGMHVYLGYTMCMLVFAATFTFFIYFGLLCHDELNGKELEVDGRKVYCEKLSSEIMLTGSGLFALIFIVFFTSYYRSKIPYEVFLYTHHLVFVVFGLAVAHTMDDKHRDGQQRSQTFKWFCGSLVLYLCDRLYMVMAGEELECLEATAQGNSRTGRVVILRLKKPVNFLFHPGQHAQLQVGCIDKSWHPFWIGSSNLEPTLDFFIEVISDNSWTGQLWTHLIEHRGHSHRDIEAGLKKLHVRIMGPYGVGYPDMKDYRHALLIGTGTGIVPLMSVLKTVYIKLRSINADIHRESCAEMRELSQECCRQIKARRHTNTLLGLLRKPQSATLGCKVSSDLSFDRRYLLNKVMRMQLRARNNSLRKLGQSGATYKALLRRQRSAVKEECFKLVLLLQLPLEVAVAGLAISWHSMVNFEGIGIDSNMRCCQYWLTWVALGVFFLFWTSTKIHSVFWLIDMVVIGGSATTYCMWLHRDVWENGFNEWQVAVIVGFALYRMVRVWCTVCGTEQSTLQSLLAHKQAARCTAPVDSIKLVYVSRGTGLPIYVWEDLEKCWSKLNEKYGDYAKQVSSIKVFITGDDEEGFTGMAKKVENTELYKSGALVMGRPDMARLIAKTVENRVSENVESLVDGSTETASSTMVAFSGSANLGSVVHRHVINLVSASKVLFGGDHHLVRFVQENHGIATMKVRKRRCPKTGTVALEEHPASWSPVDRNIAVGSNPVEMKVDPDKQEHASTDAHHSTE